MTNPEPATCRLCDSPEIELRCSFPARQLVEKWQRCFGIDIARELSGCEAIELYHCPACGLEFFLPLHVLGSSTLYASLGQFDWYYMPRKWEHDVAAAQLVAGERVLEVGCGPGEFVARLRRDLGVEAEGLEINAPACEEGRAQGIPVHLADLTEFAANHEAAFDAVCSFQVLEHVQHPKVFLEALVRLVRPGGKLLLCVPNQASFLRHQENLLDMPPHHMSRWNADTFAALPRLLPVAIESIHFEPLASYHVPGFVSAYAGVYRRRSRLARLVWNRPFRAAIRLALQCGLRNWMRGQSIYVALRRTPLRIKSAQSSNASLQKSRLLAADVG